MRLRDAKRGRNLSDEHKAELAAMKEQEQEEQSENSRESVEALMKEIREMGRLPKAVSYTHLTLPTNREV